MESSSSEEGISDESEDTTVNRKRVSNETEYIKATMEEMKHMLRKLCEEVENNQKCLKELKTFRCSRLVDK